MVRLQFGSWPSPLSASQIAGGSARLAGLQHCDDDVWWSESRPDENGRIALFHTDTSGNRVEVLKQPYSARSAVHEYGGGAWWLGDGVVYFVHWADQRIYRGRYSGEGLTDVEAITPTQEPARSVRFADGREHPTGSMVVAVSENHPNLSVGDKSSEGPTLSEQVENQLVFINTNRPETAPRIVVSGADFYSAPRFSHDGRFLSWVQWNHPQMPWDGTELYVASVIGEVDTRFELENVRKVAGGEAVSIVGADWTNDGSLVFSTDQIGYWNLAEYEPKANHISVLTSLTGSEIGGPAWVFGGQVWTELDSGDLAAVVTTAASDSLAILGRSTSKDKPPLKTVATAFTHVDEIVAGSGSDVYVIGSSVDGLTEVSKVNLERVQVEKLHQPGGRPLPDEWVSRPRVLKYTSGTGTAHAFFYPPKGEADGETIEGVEGELPPLIVMGHGGPTAHSSPSLNLKVQYWTSRGFAVVDVNYRGSSGYGRKYRQELKDTWGIVDVEDCIGAATYAVSEGLADPDRLAIRGGSAGGFTVLRALQISEVFAAGTSLYGVADLEALALDTHKFESRYLDGLIGAYPERKDVYDERSAINHTADLNCPLLVMQGTEDAVVPPSQSEAIVAAVAAKGLAHIYLPFEGEQHGFRQVESIVRSLEVELWFYGQLFGFEHADMVQWPPEAVGFE